MSEEINGGKFVCPYCKSEVDAKDVVECDECLNSICVGCATICETCGEPLCPCCADIAAICDECGVAKGFYDLMNCPLCERCICVDCMYDHLTGRHSAKP